MFFQSADENPSFSADPNYHEKMSPPGKIGYNVTMKTGDGSLSWRVVIISAPCYNEFHSEYEVCMMLFLLILSEEEQLFFTDIYYKHHKRMLYTATQILGIDRAEEAVHDVFLKLIAKFEKNKNIIGDKHAHFFVIVVRNHSLDILRRERLNTISFEDDLIDNDLLHSSAINPEDALLSNEALEKLAGLITKLTPGTRQILEYKYIEGFSNIEIAQMLNLTQTAVSSQVNRAKKRLKELLEREVDVGAC